MVHIEEIDMLLDCRFHELHHQNQRNMRRIQYKAIKAAILDIFMIITRCAPLSFSTD